MNVKYLANLIRTMQCYFYFLIFQLIAIVALIVYVFIDFGKNHNEGLVFAVECALTSIIILEILIKMFSNKKEFFDNIWNIIDLVGILAITGLFFGLLFFETKKSATTGKYSGERDLIPAILLGTRYIVQVIRIIITLKQSRDVRNVAEDHIVFTNQDPKSEESRSQIDMSIRV